MKNLFALIILLSIACTSTQAQKISFTDSTNKWRVVEWDWGYIGNIGYGYLADSVTIDTLQYKQLSSGVNRDSILIRTDTSGQKIYAKVYRGSIQHAGQGFLDTFEHLLYDFSLQVGDTFKYKNFRHVVYNIDSTQINNTWHKVFHLRYVSGPIQSLTYVVIEGIGCTRGLLYPLGPVDFEGSLQLSCFNNSSGQPIVNPKVDNYFDNDVSCHLSVDDLDAAKNAIKVYPQPASSLVNIEVSENMDGTLVLYNMNGQVVAKQEVHHTKHIVFTPNVALTGIYFYKLYNSKNSQLHTGTISFL